MSARSLAVAVCSMSCNNERFSDFLLEVKQFQHVKFTYICIQNHLRSPDPASFIDYDAAILLHPISMGRLSITDVKDARYDVFLPLLRDTFGRDRVAVLISECNHVGQDSLRSSQPTAFECSAFLRLCNQLTDSEVMSLIASFVSHVPSVPKPDPKHVLAKYQLDKPPKAGDSAASSNMKVDSITVQMASFNDRGLTQDMDDIDFIVWANTRTRDVLLETLCSQDLVAFTVFEQMADGWRRVRPSSLNDVDQSQAFQECAVFIYRDNIPTDLTDDHVHELALALEGNNQSTPVTVKGKCDSIFYDQFLQLAKGTTTGMVLIVSDVEETKLKKSFSVARRSKNFFSKIQDTMEKEFEEEMAMKSEIRNMERKLKKYWQENSTLENEIKDRKQEITYLQEVRKQEEQKLEKVKEKMKSEQTSKENRKPKHEREEREKRQSNLKEDVQKLQEEILNLKETKKKMEEDTNIEEDRKKQVQREREKCERERDILNQEIKNMQARKAEMATAHATEQDYLETNTTKLRQKRKEGQQLISERNNEPETFPNTGKKYNHTTDITTGSSSVESLIKLFNFLKM